MGHEVGEHVVEPVQWLFEPRRERACRNSTPGEATLASLNNVDVFGIHVEPEGSGLLEGLFARFASRRK